MFYKKNNNLAHCGVQKDVLEVKLLNVTKNLHYDRKMILSGAEWYQM